MLVAFLDSHHNTFLGKIRGLTTEQANRTHPPTDLTLARLVKHLANVEDAWWQRVTGDPMPEPWASAPWDADPDWDLHSADGEDLSHLVSLYQTAIERGRATLDAIGSLDTKSALPNRPGGETFTVRWVLLHLIEETARHNGHADLLREAVDGARGE